MANDATLSRRRKMFPRSCIRGKFLDSSGKTNRILISGTRLRFEPGFPGRVRAELTTRPNWLYSAIDHPPLGLLLLPKEIRLAERSCQTLLSRGTRVQISPWSLLLRFDLSLGTNRGYYHGYSCEGTTSLCGSAWRLSP